MKRIRLNPNSGFSFPELLVAVAVAATLITAAVIGFGTIARIPTRGGRVDVSLNTAVLTNFYGPSFTGAYVTLALSPNYSQGVEARRLKDRLMADVSSATAVFCLGRNQQVASSQRPSQLRVTNTDLRNMATPAAFASFLTNTPALSNGAVIFAGNTNGVLAQTNSSLFVLGGLDSTSQGGTNKLDVVATYEVDFVPTTTPVGTYATVRRYAGTSPTPTDYYHLFYPDENNTGSGGFRPLGVYFGRYVSPSGTGTPLQISNVTNPFSFVWWPDPLSSSLSNRSTISWGTGAAVRSNYANMGGRTSLFFAIPTFPGQ